MSLKQHFAGGSRGELILLSQLLEGACKCHFGALCFSDLHDHITFPLCALSASPVMTLSSVS